MDPNEARFLIVDWCTGIIKRIEHGAAPKGEDVAWCIEKAKRVLELLAEIKRQ